MIEQEDREAFVKANAVVIVTELEQRVEGYKKTITQLEASKRSLRASLAEARSESTVADECRKAPVLRPGGMRKTDLQGAAWFIQCTVLADAMQTDQSVVDTFDDAATKLSYAFLVGDELPYDRLGEAMRLLAVYGKKNDCTVTLTRLRDGDWSAAVFKKIGGLSDYVSHVDPLAAAEAAIANAGKVDDQSKWPVSEKRELL